MWNFTGGYSLTPLMESRPEIQSMLGVEMMRTNCLTYENL